jgi:hypothetical protein
MRHYVIRIEVVFFARSSEIAFIEKVKIEFIGIVLNVN